MRCHSIGTAASQMQSRTQNGYTNFRSRLHDGIIRVFDGAGNVIETHEHAGDFKARTLI
jgi:hypothetical protein